MTTEINALLQVLLRVENVARHVGSFCRKAHVENALFACIHLVIVLNMEYIKTKVTELNTKRQIIINFFQIEKSLSYFHIAHTIMRIILQSIKSVWDVQTGGKKKRNWFRL